MESEDWRGKVGPLDDRELAEFLTEPHIARVACLDDDGWPYVVPCWHEWDGNAFWVVPRAGSAWASYLAVEPRCAITVDEEGRQRKVVARCLAALVEEPNVGGRWVSIARRMSTRYLGEHGVSYLWPTLERPRWLFRLDPVSLRTWQGQDWAQRYR
ncbi:pyridoxamine 5'-phosphate oxidase family protein [Streptoalloteichus hindustanus]|uniref:Pyridoxamine 5'-phosphate oxidase n=1 Tax=Streptoalloteichus hindustanus TaxID=2017 RepID=A0A1M5EMI7_STRHI|nr:pyridoxamine 5'-phosphate oxidase family protein [Streptoalloteichus hindustanus]SHF80503.1 Pyridoxamine 5'-phosphate oxidase [Streptoalloteichus hindustanus]